jgi:hypothetical protein
VEQSGGESGHVGMGSRLGGAGGERGHDAEAKDRPGYPHAPPSAA